MAAADAMIERRFPTVGSSELMADAISIAFATKRTVYDSLYISLAIRFDAEMITADERLANSVAARLPVKWLGAMLT